LNFLFKRFLKQYFDVNEEYVKSRFLHSFIPFNPYFHDISKEKPDLYGPFWIYSTLVFIIAAAGEISSYLNGDVDKSYFEEFVPTSTMLVRIIFFNLIFLYSLFY